MEQKEKMLETVHAKVLELKQLCNTKDLPTSLQVWVVIQIHEHVLYSSWRECMVVWLYLYSQIHWQVMEADLQKKINNVQELCAQAQNNLSDFCSQKKQLEDFLSQMTEWLKTLEGSLQDTASGSPPEEICRVKVQMSNQI